MGIAWADKNEVPREKPFGSPIDPVVRLPLLNEKNLEVVVVMGVIRPLSRQSLARDMTGIGVAQVA